MTTTLDERLAASELSPAERRVARFLVDHGEEAAFLSAVEIGGQLGTSDATVVRTVKRLGYAGYVAWVLPRGWRFTPRCWPRSRPR